MEFVTANLSIIIAVAICMLIVVGYKLVLRVFGVVIIPEDKTGIVIKKFRLFGDNKSLQDGRIIATKGEAGIQAQQLTPGVHFFLWPWQYEIKAVNLTKINPGMVGKVEAIDGGGLAPGKILATAVDCENFQNAAKFLDNGGRKGKQTKILSPGVYRINTELFKVSEEPAKTIKEGKVGIVTVHDGEPLHIGEIAGPSVEGHNNFQDIDVFLSKKGMKGLQTDVILAGTYYLNSWAVDVEEIDMTEIPIGFVGVVNSFVGEAGEDVSGKEFKHGNIVKKGCKGVWITVLDPGKYPINKKIAKVEVVSITNIVLNWATGRNESHALDQNLSTIKVRSKDGFEFTLDVSQIINIPAEEAPKVIARFGSVANLVSQVLEPTIGNYFRNSAQKSDAIDFLTERSERQREAKEHINKVLDQYNVNGVDTLIGDINTPSELMKILTDRKIADQQKETYVRQMEAQISRKEFEQQKATADMQKSIIEANLNVEIAEKIADAKVKEAKGKAESVKIEAAANAEKTKVNAEADAFRTEQIGNAEAAKILAIGNSTAEAYEKQVAAMGGDNFASFKIMEVIGHQGVKVMPQVLVMGDGKTGGPLDALLGFKALEMAGEKLNTDSIKARVSQDHVEGVNNNVVV